MNSYEKTCNSIIMHCNKYPLLQLQDIFKFLFQSTFGCGHMISDKNKAAEYLKLEYEGLTDKSYSEIEALDGNYSRVPLSYINNGLAPETFAGLFCLSAEKDKGTEEDLCNKLSIVRELIEKKLIPFKPDDFDIKVNEWKSKGFSAIHHSDEFRKAYKPSYRVISDDFIPFLPVFSSIDKLKAVQPVRLALEGKSASGKSTLSKVLEKVYDCTVFHMDDFFLQPSQRTKERLSQTGGNVDYERFIKEVLTPLKNNNTVIYRRFDCGEMKLLSPENITPSELCIIEGVYSMHPAFGNYYDISIFLDISSEYQKERILKRNPPFLAKRFFNEWIPMENEYFEKTDIKNRCNICIDINKK